MDRTTLHERVCLRLLGHMASCTYITQNARLYLHSIKGWIEISESNQQSSYEHEGAGSLRSPFIAELISKTLSRYAKKYYFLHIYLLRYWWWMPPHSGM